MFGTGTQKYVQIVVEAVDKSGRTFDEVRKRVEALQKTLEKQQTILKRQETMGRPVETYKKTIANTKGELLKAQNQMNSFNGSMEERSRIETMVNNGLVKSTETQSKYNKIGGKWVKTAEQMRERGARFRMELLSVMFFGMLVQRTFQNLLQPALELTGVFDIFTVTLELLFLPIALVILGWAIKFLEYISKIPDDVKIAIGVFVLLGFVLGTVLFIGASVLLGIVGLAMAFSSMGLIVIGLVAGLTLFIILLAYLGGGTEAVKDFTEGVWGAITGFADLTLIAMESFGTIIENFSKTIDINDLFKQSLGEGKEAIGGMTSEFGSTKDAVEEMNKRVGETTDVIEEAKTPASELEDTITTTSGGAGDIRDAFGEIDMTQIKDDVAIIAESFIKISSTVDDIARGMRVFAASTSFVTGATYAAMTGKWWKVSDLYKKYKDELWDIYAPDYGTATTTMWNKTPTTTGLQEGGIVTRPTRAIIGEAGPEAVVPLSKGFNSLDYHPNVTVNVTATSNVDIDRLKSQLSEDLTREVYAGLRR